MNTFEPLVLTAWFNAPRKPDRHLAAPHDAVSRLCPGAADVLGVPFLLGTADAAGAGFSSG